VGDGTESFAERLKLVWEMLQALVKSKHSMYGFFLSNDPAHALRLDHGGIDLQRVARASELHWHESGKPGLLQVKLKDILVDGRPLNVCSEYPNGLCPADVDATTPWIVGPGGDVAPLLQADEMLWCGQPGQPHPEVTMQLMDVDGNTVEYPLSADDLTLMDRGGVGQTTPSGWMSWMMARFPEARWHGVPAQLMQKVFEEPHCSWAVREDSGAEAERVLEKVFGARREVGSGHWILGQPFLRRYYSVYMPEQSRIGFVKSQQPGEAPTSLGISPSLGMVPSLTQLVLLLRCHVERQDAKQRRLASLSEFL
jgi:hypothetical protein